MHLLMLLTCTLATFMAAYAAPTQDSNSDKSLTSRVPLPPNANRIEPLMSPSGLTRRDPRTRLGLPSGLLEGNSHSQYARLSERDAPELATRDSWLSCSYKWMGKAKFCGGSCNDIDVVEGTAPEQIIRLDHTLPCPTNTNSGAIRINNLKECRESEGGSCWTGTKVLCRYGCLGVVSSA